MAAANASRASKTESRVERKRQAARERIIQAAERLMRSRPVEEVTISDITSAADVGHGTFYLHFSSKYEVLVPIVQAVAAPSSAIRPRTRASGSRRFCAGGRE